jgi:hypothetical protein
LQQQSIAAQHPTDDQQRQAHDQQDTDQRHATLARPHRNAPGKSITRRIAG